MDLALIRKWLKKQPNTEENNHWHFHSTWPALNRTYPILPTDQWPSPGLDFLKQQQNPRTQDLNQKIDNLLNQGWIVPSWCDFVLTTRENSETIELQYPQQIHNYTPVIEIINPQDWGEKANLLPTTLTTVIKYTSPWNFKCPQGWGLLTLPLQFHNERRFSALTNLINPEHDNKIVTYLLWHQPNFKTLVRAGTPLFQIIPCPLPRPNTLLTSEDQIKIKTTTFATNVTHLPSS